MRKKKEQIVEVSIQSLSKEGDGVGYYGELQHPIEIPFTFVGDTVAALVTKKNRKKRTGKLLEIIQPSSQRIIPLCKHFGSCGGCRLQHISYEEQLKQKTLRIEKLFTPFLSNETELLPIIPCSSPWKYRNKMEYSFSQNKAGEKFLGLILANTRGHVFNLTDCHLTNSWFVEILDRVRTWWQTSSLKAYHPSSNQGSLRTLIVREGMTSGNRMVMLTVSGNPEFALHKNDLQSFTAAIKELDPGISLFLRIQQVLKGEQTQFYEMHLGGPEAIRESLSIEDINLKFDISPSSFFQPNTFQAEKIYRLAVQLSNVTQESVVYDLYCGTGTLGIAFAKFCKKVIGVEISAESSLDARTNAKNNGLENVEIFTGPCADVLHKIREEKSMPPPDLILLDPPRAGLETRALNEVCALNCRSIIYISCNPETQAKDTAFFIENGYQLLKIQPVDQFPQTMHIENILYLSK